MKVKIGRLTKEDMMDFVNEHRVKAIVDASHPFAEEASKNAIGAAAETAIPYIRYERASQAFTYDNMTMVSTYEEAAEVAAVKKELLCSQQAAKRCRFLQKSCFLFQMYGLLLVCFQGWIIWKSASNWDSRKKYYCYSRAVYKRV